MQYFYLQCSFSISFHQFCFNIVNPSLQSVPGLSPVSIAAIIAETGDINRFETVNKYIGYIRLYSVRFQSGKTDFFSRMTRKGNKLLKDTRHWRRHVHRPRKIRKRRRQSRWHQTQQQRRLRREIAGVSIPKITQPRAAGSKILEALDIKLPTPSDDIRKVSTTTKQAHK